MPGTLAHSPAEITSQLLIDFGLGSEDGVWPIRYSAEPATPDETITVYDTTGFSNGRTMPDGELQGQDGVQIRVRGQTHRTAWLKANDIRIVLSEDVLNEVVMIDSETYVFHAAVGIGNVLSLGKESPTSSRRLFTVNLLTSIRQR